MKLGAITLAWRYVSRHSAQSILLALAVGVVIALPLGVRVVVQAAEQQLRARAAATPLVAGAPGSAADLLLTALHFRRGAEHTLPVGACDVIRETRMAEAIPLNTRHRAQGTPIVGTEIDYFDFRNLTLADGRMLTRLGDCVLGAKVAAARGLKAGDSVYSSPEQVFDLAGVYPLKMRITGVLAPTGTPDDEAIFVDTKTAWLIQGIAHGHEDLVTAPQDVLRRDEQGNPIASAAVRMYAEVTDENVGSFHFHGDSSEYPIDAVLVLPHSDKDAAILFGRYQQSKELQLIRASEVLEDLLAALFQMERLVVGALLLVAGAALVVVILVFHLSFRLRRHEFTTLAHIGIGRGTLILTQGVEVFIVGASAAMIAWGLRTIVAAMSDALFWRNLGG